MKKLLVLMALMSFLIVGIVNAVNSVTINTGGSADRIDGAGIDFNLTIGSVTADVVINCSVTMTSPSTANSTVGKVFIISNSTATSGD